VYSFDPRTNAYHVVYVFPEAKSAASPVGPLTVGSGVLYGVTLYGGMVPGCNCGSVYALTPSGKKTTVHEFRPTEGRQPNGGLVLFNGNLYGTTKFGGSKDLGTVFALSPSGSYQELHDFTGGIDGSMPYAGLTVANGVLYGTTSQGGSSNCGGYGCGVVYSITTAGQEEPIYTFTGSPADGWSPRSRVTYYNGYLYGTTSEGGTNWGILFKLSLDGHEQILHEFLGGADGAIPLTGVNALNGYLYGATGSGGTGCGTAGGGCGTFYVTALNPLAVNVIPRRYH
jgi:uncharacterized repeat protein (TIGR03803 family)